MYWSVLHRGWLTQLYFPMMFNSCVYKSLSAVADILHFDEKLLSAVVVCYHCLTLKCSTFYDVNVFYVFAGPSKAHDCIFLRETVRNLYNRHGNVELFFKYAGVKTLDCCSGRVPCSLSEILQLC